MTIFSFWLPQISLYLFNPQFQSFHWDFYLRCPRAPFPKKPGPWQNFKEVKKIPFRQRKSHGTNNMSPQSKWYVVTTRCLTLWSKMAVTCHYVTYTYMLLRSVMSRFYRMVIEKQGYNFKRGYCFSCSIVLSKPCEVLLQHLVIGAACL